MIDYKALIQDDRIHVSLYTDPRIFADEMDRIFTRGWVFVGHASEIPRPGDYVTRTLGTQPVIMVRGKDSAVSVLVNRCMHRGTMLCTAGRGATRTFACPYHGWTYDLDGALLGVPYPGGYTDFDKSAHGLRHARAAVAAPARGRRGEGHQGRRTRLGQRPPRDRLVARLSAAVRVVRQRVGAERRELRGRAGAPRRPRGGAPPHHGGPCARADLPQPVPRRDQRGHRAAHERRGVRALAHADVLGGRARVQQPPAPHERGGHGAGVVPDARGPDRRRAQPGRAPRVDRGVARDRARPQTRG